MSYLFTSEDDSELKLKKVSDLKITLMKLSTQNIIIHLPSELLSEFKEMVNRAFNCWPDASPAMKEFADMITNDKVMQDYWAQNSNKRIKLQEEED